MAPKSPQDWRRATTIAVATVVMSCWAAIGPARALDDGEAPIWTGLTTLVAPVVGIGKEEKGEIQYRERSKLVIPPKMELPKPGTGLGAKLPPDQDVQHAKKMKALEDNQPSTLPIGRVTQPLVKPGAVVTMSATAGSGPSGVTCVNDGVAVACPQSGTKTAVQPAAAAAAAGTASPTKGAQLNWNPLTWVGIQKKPDVVLGPEPDRSFLTDPPPGLRAPVEGVGAKVKSD